MSYALIAKVKLIGHSHVFLKKLGMTMTNSTTMYGSCNKKKKKVY